MCLTKWRFIREIVSRGSLDIHITCLIALIQFVNNFITKCVIGHITQWYYKFSTAVRTIDDQIKYLATVLGEWLVIRNRGDLRRKEEFCQSVDYLRLWLAKTSYLSSMPWAPSYSLEDETTGSTARTLFIVYRLICLFSQAWVVKIRTIILIKVN